MAGRRKAVLAVEGIPFLLAGFVAVWLVWQFAAPVWAVLPAAATVLVYLLFRDPVRRVPPRALGIVSPVDGRVISSAVEAAGDAAPMLRLRIRVNALGTYTARAPVEGTVRNPSSGGDGKSSGFPANCLWIRTDEGDDVVLQFSGYRLGLPPRAVTRYGERLGQGQRCAYLRLARFVDVLAPPDSQALVEPGNRVRGGTDLIGNLPKP